LFPSNVTVVTPKKELRGKETKSQGGVHKKGEGKDASTTACHFKILKFKKRDPVKTPTKRRDFFKPH